MVTLVHLNLDYTTNRIRVFIKNEYITSLEKDKDLEINIALIACKYPPPYEFWYNGPVPSPIETDDFGRNTGLSQKTIVLRKTLINLNKYR